MSDTSSTYDEDDHTASHESLGSLSDSDTVSVVSTVHTSSSEASEEDSLAHVYRNKARSDPSTFNIATVNVRQHLGTQVERELFAREMRKRDWHAVAMQEVYARPNTEQVILGVLFWTGAAQSRPRDETGCVMCSAWAIVQSKFRRIVPKSKASDTRVLLIHLNFKGNQYNLVNVYRPYLAAKWKTAIENVDCVLNDIKKRFPKRLVVVGDFNVQPDLLMARSLGSVQKEFEPFLTTAIANDQRLKDLGKDLLLMNFSSTPSPEKWGVPHGVTWLGPQKNNKPRQMRCYDLIFASADIAPRSLTTFRASNPEDTSDHFAMVCSIRHAFVPGETLTQVREPRDDRISHLVQEWRNGTVSMRNLPCRRVIRVENLRKSIRDKEKETPVLERSAELKREIRSERRNLRREIKRLERRMFMKKAQAAGKAAAKGNLKKAFSLIDEILERNQRSEKIEQGELHTRAREAISSLTQEPAFTFEVPHMERQPDDFCAIAESWVTGYTDGSRFRTHGIKSAGAGVWVPQFDWKLKARVPPNLRQTSELQRSTANHSLPSEGTALR